MHISVQITLYTTYLRICVYLLLSCYFQNASVGPQLYESDWYSCSTRFKRSMIIIIMNLQKPAYISIGKFSPLCLTTFLAVSFYYTFTINTWYVHYFWHINFTFTNFLHSYYCEIISFYFYKPIIFFFLTLPLIFLSNIYYTTNTYTSSIHSVLDFFTTFVIHCENSFRVYKYLICRQSTSSASPKKCLISKGVKNSESVLRPFIAKFQFIYSFLILN